MLRNIVFILVCLALPALHYSQEINQVDENGDKQGKWRKMYSNGAIRYQGQFNNDNPVGEFRYYYESSALKAITMFSDDGTIARTRTFYENGKMMAEGKYINQEKDSTWRFFGEENGELIAEENYVNGKLNGSSITFFTGTTQPAEYIEYKNDIKDGKYLKYFPNGNILLEGKYQNGQLQGEYFVYYPDGRIEVKGNYVNGLKTGNWTYYDPQGRQLTEDEYRQEKEEK